MTIAITGGIGSGKSFVCRQLEQRGITIYDCDSEARHLMATSAALQQALSAAIGTDIFPGGKMDKGAVARFLMASEENAATVNNIVHPAVAADFKTSGKEWIESAILYDSGFYDRIMPDFTVCVTAPDSMRRQRIMTRDAISREKADEWIAAQMSQEEKAARADFVIVNDGRDIDSQIDTLLARINKLKHNTKQ